MLEHQGRLAANRAGIDLVQGEYTVAEFGPHWFSRFGSWISFFLFSFGALNFAALGSEFPWGTGLFLLLAVGAFAPIVIDKNFTIYTVTSFRCLSSEGLLVRRKKELAIRDIRFVETRQNIVETLFSVGHVMLYSAGTEKAVMVFRGVQGHEAIKKLIQGLRVEDEGSR